MIGANQRAKRTAARLTRLLKLEGWDIRISCHDGCLNGDRGEIMVLSDYRQAVITIDPASHKDLDELDRTVCHEFLHIVLAPYEGAKRVVQSGLDKGCEIDRVMVEAFSQAEELIISHFEQIGFPYDQL